MKGKTTDQIMEDVMRTAIICEGTNRVASFLNRTTGQKFYVLTRYQLEKLGEGKIQ
jgi:hypothetical protein